MVRWPWTATPVLDVCGHRPCKHHRLKVASACCQLSHGLAVADVSGVLGDDRSFVELGGRVVGRGSDQLDTRAHALVDTGWLQ